MQVQFSLTKEKHGWKYQRNVKSCYYGIFIVLGKASRGFIVFVLKLLAIVLFDLENSEIAQIWSFQFSNPIKKLPYVLRTVICVWAGDKVIRWTKAWCIWDSVKGFATGKEFVKEMRHNLWCHIMYAKFMRKPKA